MGVTRGHLDFGFKIWTLMSPPLLSNLPLLTEMLISSSDLPPCLRFAPLIRGIGVF